MAAILNSAISNLVILESAILVFPLKLTHTCQDWFPPLAQKNFHSFIHTELDDGSHLEFCHVGFSFCIMEFRHLVFTPADSLKNTLPPFSLWLKLIHFDSLDNGSHLEFCHLGFSFCIMEFRHLVFTPADSLKNTLPPLRLWLKLIQSESNSFIHTELDDGSHLEFCHVGFRHCHVGIRHLVIFSQIHSKILSIHSDSDLKLIHSDSNSFILTELDEDSHLEFSQLGFSHLAQKTSLIHSDLTWWWQPSWIPPSWIQPS